MHPYKITHQKAPPIICGTIKHQIAAAASVVINHAAKSLIYMFFRGSNFNIAIILNMHRTNIATGNPLLDPAGTINRKTFKKNIGVNSTRIPISTHNNKILLCFNILVSPIVRIIVNKFKIVILSTHHLDLS